MFSLGHFQLDFHLFKTLRTETFWALALKCEMLLKDFLGRDGCSCEGNKSFVDLQQVLLRPFMFLLCGDGDAEAHFETLVTSLKQCYISSPIPKSSCLEEREVFVQVTMYWHLCILALSDGHVTRRIWRLEVV